MMSGIAGRNPPAGIDWIRPLSILAALAVLPVRADDPPIGRALPPVSTVKVQQGAMPVAGQPVTVWSVPGGDPWSRRTTDAAGEARFRIPTGYKVVFGTRFEGALYRSEVMVAPGTVDLVLPAPIPPAPVAVAATLFGEDHPDPELASMVRVQWTLCDGDVDMNGLVDQTDLDIAWLNAGITVANGWLEGDMNGDHLVTVEDDIAVIQAQLGASCLGLGYRFHLVSDIDTDLDIADIVGLSFLVNPESYGEIAVSTQADGRESEATTIELAFPPVITSTDHVIDEDHEVVEIRWTQCCDPRIVGYQLWAYEDGFIDTDSHSVWTPHIPGQTEYSAEFNPEGMQDAILFGVTANGTWGEPVILDIRYSP